MHNLDASAIDRFNDSRKRAMALRDWLASHPDATEADKVARTKALGFHTQRTFDEHIRKVQSKLVK